MDLNFIALINCCTDVAFGLIWAVSSLKEFLEKPDNKSVADPEGFPRFPLKPPFELV